jgi:hypothetical protein
MPLWTGSRLYEKSTSQGSHEVSSMMCRFNLGDSRDHEGKHDDLGSSSHHIMMR